MPAKKKTAQAADEAKSKASRVRKPAAPQVQAQPGPAKSKGAELEVDWREGGQGRINQEAVEAATDRVFQSVLSRFGWMRDQQGRIEHVGAERR